MATKLDAIKMAETCAKGFNVLAEEIEKKHRNKLVYQWIREELIPRIKKWEDADPVLYARTVRACNTKYVEVDDQYYTLPGDLKVPSLPDDLITLKVLVEECKDNTVREEMAKAKELREKAESFEARLAAFLEGFTSVEQAIFSLPELKAFAPVKCASQKRPRVFKVPSNDLRREMMEAARLQEAFNAKK